MTKTIPAIYVEKRPVKLDPNGFFVINLYPKDRPNKMDVEYYSYVPKPNVPLHLSPPKLEKIIITTLSDIREKKLTFLDIIRTLDSSIDVRLQADHYAYLGKELFLAYHCLLHGKTYTRDEDYEQGGCN